MDHYKDIEMFHEKFGLKPFSKVPAMLPDEIMSYRYKFMQEELNEMMEDYAAGNLEGVADAIVDLVYVALGTAYLMKLPYNQLWDEVHIANMSKVRAKSKKYSKRNSEYDVVKPAGWVPPNIKQILKIYGAKL